MTEYADLLRALCDAGVRFLIVGGYATIAHGYTRATEDLDVWIEPSRENARRALRALAAFGADVSELGEQTLADPYTFFRIGEPTGRRIDIMGAAEGLEFPRAWRDRFETEIFGVAAPFLSLRDLLRNKRAVGRHKDLADVEGLLAFHGLSDESVE